jgi:hypothetical protein
MTKKIGGRKRTKSGANKSNGVPLTAEKPGSKRVRRYLSAQFTRQLVEHMHRAKKAALEGRE